MSVNTKMTAIADEIRILSGTTGTMGLDAMATNVGNANSEIVDQNGVLEQIKSVLEGKAVSGGSVETCTVEVHVTRGGIANALLYGYSYTSFVDGAYSPKYAQINGYIGGGYPSSSAVSDVIFYNVVCGSLITLSISKNLGFWDISIDNVNLLQCGSVGNSACPQIIIQAPSEPDSVGVINLDYTD